MHLASVAQLCFLPITFFGLSQHKGFGYLKSELDKFRGSGAQGYFEIKGTVSGSDSNNLSFLLHIRSSALKQVGNLGSGFADL